MNPEAKYWNSMASYGRDASVIDPFDRSGRKNAYITALRNEALIGELRGLAPGAKVLDFGCGSGNITRSLSEHGFQAVGLDISAALLNLAGRVSTDPPMPYVLFDGAHLPIRNDSFDAIVTYVVLNHVISDHDLASLLTELHRVLRKGGRMVAIEQVRRRDAIDAIRHSHRRTLETFQSLFVCAGFELLQHRTIRFGHFPMIYLVRYGLVPSAAHRLVAAAERSLGRVHPVPWLDYADVVFTLSK